MANFKIYIAVLTHALKELLTHDTRQCLANAFDLDINATISVLSIMINLHS